MDDEGFQPTDEYRLDPEVSVDVGPWWMSAIVVAIGLGLVARGHRRLGVVLVLGGVLGLVLSRT